MIPGIHPILQVCLGTLFTWGLTAAGAGLVIIFSEHKRKLLDTSLGFAAGVMIAASYWSLLEPAIEMAADSGSYGVNGEFAFVPVAIGFFIGALFVFITDILISKYNLGSPSLLLAYCQNGDKKLKNQYCDETGGMCYANSATEEGPYQEYTNSNTRRRVTTKQNLDSDQSSMISEEDNKNLNLEHWKRMLLLIVAITVHNIPEGLAVGVAFAGIGSSDSATFEKARNLAVGIGIQNFPEGLAVSLPLKAAGFSTWKSFWYGQLSGMVEPISGLLGVLMISVAKPTLPYALSFAAGAMIYVVIDDIIPEANTGVNGKYASWGSVAGFIIMMALDVGLG